MSTQEKPAAGRQRGLVQTTPKGRLALWVIDPGFLVFQLIGHGDGGFASPIIAGFERSLHHGTPVKMFVDAALMVSYDTMLRTEVTAAFRVQRQRIECLHILVRSKMVAMGVSVANLALGGMMTIHQDDAPFHAALETRLTKSRVVGFSSSTLAQERQRKPG